MKKTFLLLLFLFITTNAYTADTGNLGGAVFAGSWTAVKIDITSGTGTLAQLVTDVNDATVMETVGATTTIKPSSLGVIPRELEISSGVTLNHQVDSHTLAWTWGVTTGTYATLDVASGGTFNIGDGTTGGDDCVLDFADTIGGGRGDRAYIYVYGSFNVQGTDGHECILKHYRSIYFYSRVGNDCDFDWFKLQSDITYTSGYMTGFSVADSTGSATVSLDNGRIECLGATEAGYGMYFYGSGFFENLSFNNIVIENTLAGLYGRGSTFKMSNCTFKDTASSYPRFYDCGKNQGSVYETSKTEPFTKAVGQPKVVFDTCTFDNNRDDAGTNYAIYGLARGSVILFKDCTFKNAYYGVYAYDGGVAIYTGTTTFDTITTDRRWSSNGTHLHGRMLTLTVQDIDGTAIENAMCYLREGSNRDYFAIETNASGEAKDLWGDDCVLIEKEETATTTYTDWDDYTLIVSHASYDTQVITIDPTADITQTVTLRPQGTTIIDSVLYDSQIF